MNRYASAIVAGFVATVVLSLLMVLKAALGLMPQLDVIQMLAQMVSARTGLPAVPVVGWITHFLIGTLVWGVAFALLVTSLPGRSGLSKGLAFSVLAWLLMMLIPMPMAGAGVFGLKLGVIAPVMTLILHLIWGAVLGTTHDRLAKNRLEQSRA